MCVRRLTQETFISAQSVHSFGLPSSMYSPGTALCWTCAGPGTQCSQNKSVVLSSVVVSNIVGEASISKQRNFGLQLV